MSDERNKRQKNVTNTTAFNSTRFQNLICTDITSNIKLALAVAQECDYDLDNSRLYGVTKQKKYCCMLKIWVKLSTPGDYDTTKQLFDIILQTGGQNDFNFRLYPENFFEFAALSHFAKLPMLECLLSQPDLFPIEDLIFYLGAFETSASHLITQCINTISLKPNAYELFNTVNCVYSNRPILSPLLYAIKKSNIFTVQKFLECIPLIDLDLFSYPLQSCSKCYENKLCGYHNGWYSVEEKIVLDVQMNGLVRTGREILECYREKRALFIQVNLQILSTNVIGIINEYGKRPQEQTFIEKLDIIEQTRIMSIPKLDT